MSEFANSESRPAQRESPLELPKTMLSILRRQMLAGDISQADPSPTLPWGRSGPPNLFVVDTNVLRADIFYRCRHPAAPTQLIAQAAAGMTRLYCAPHVVDELWEHYPEWSVREGIEASEFLAIWESEYVGNLRVVSGVDRAMLADDERASIDMLEDRDADDVPLAVLACVLHAPILSRDGALLTSLLGEDGARSVQDWLPIVHAGVNAGVIDEAFDSATVVASALVVASFEGAAAIWKILPNAIRFGILLGLAVVLPALWKRVPPDVKSAMGADIGALAGTVDSLMIERRTSLASLAAAAPLGPERQALATRAGVQNVLGRALVMLLGRDRRRSLSAAEAAKALPHLGVAQSVAYVRRELRSRECFIEISPGRWQLGDRSEAMRDASEADTHCP